MGHIPQLEQKFTRHFGCGEEVGLEVSGSRLHQRVTGQPATSQIFPSDNVMYSCLLKCGFKRLMIAGNELHTYLCGLG